MEIDSDTDVEITIHLTSKQWGALCTQMGTLGQAVIGKDNKTLTIVISESQENNGIEN